MGPTLLYLNRIHCILAHFLFISQNRLYLQIFVRTWIWIVVSRILITKSKDPYVISPKTSKGHHGIQMPGDNALNFHSKHVLKAPNRWLSAMILPNRKPKYKSRKQTISVLREVNVELNIRSKDLWGFTERWYYIWQSNQRKL